MTSQDKVRCFGLLAVIALIIMLLDSRYGYNPITAPILKPVAKDYHPQAKAFVKKLGQEKGQNYQIKKVFTYYTHNHALVSCGALQVQGEQGLRKYVIRDGIRQIMHGKPENDPKLNYKFHLEKSSPAFDQQYDYWCQYQYKQTQKRLLWDFSQNAVKPPYEDTGCVIM